MYTKSFAFAMLFIGAQCRYLLVEEQPVFVLVDDDSVILGEDEAEHYSGPQEMFQVEPIYYPRVRRQAETTMSVDSSGNTDFTVKSPIAGNDKKALSLIGSQSTKSQSVGVSLDHANGHSLTLSQRTIPDYGKQLTADGKLNLMNTDKHNVNANAFVTRTSPKFPNSPDYNTFGGGVGYTFDKKIGASVGAAHTDFLKQTDVNALGHLNLFRNRDSSLDLHAGVTRSFSPHIPHSTWEPTGGLSYHTTWPKWFR